jgi:regulator of cell morphogenesis and NO signaling
MENKLNSNETVGAMVNKIPGSGKVLEELGVDYYCDGDKSLAEACAEIGYDPDGILEGIYNTIPENIPRCERDLSKADMYRLLDHMTEQHYGFVLGVTPSLNRLMKQVLTRHGKSHPELIELDNLFTLLCEDLGRHMLKEENLLYKLTRQFESGDEITDLSDELPEKQVQFLKLEHSNAITLIGKIRHLTNGYVVPEYACSVYRSMIQKMRKMEFDLHRHIHEENNIIYPRALQT